MTDSLFRLLICIPSPRDLPDFAGAINKIPWDRYWVKYTPYEQGPYQQFRQFFLDNKQYTHLAICPDDLIVTPEGVDQLVKDAEKYPVIMGTCNVDTEDHPNGRMAVTKNMPAGERSARTYDFYTKKELLELPTPIIQVPWCGTPFAIFERSVVEKIGFIGDGRWNLGEKSYSFDVDIAHDLKDQEIPLMVDSRAYFFHHRTGDTMKLGLLPPQTWYDVGLTRIINSLVTREAHAN